MKKENAVIVALAVLATVAAAIWVLFLAPELPVIEISTQQRATPQSADHFDLRIGALWVFAVIGLGVFTAMLISIFLHRKSSNHVIATLSHSTLAEIIWTLIPILILVGMALPAISELLQKSHLPSNGESMSTTLISRGSNPGYRVKGLGYTSQRTRQEISA